MHEVHRLSSSQSFKTDVEYLSLKLCGCFIHLNPAFPPYLFILIIFSQLTFRHSAATEGGQRVQHFTELMLGAFDFVSCAQMIYSEYNDGTVEMDDNFLFCP